MARLPRQSSGPSSVCPHTLFETWEMPLTSTLPAVPFFLFVYKSAQSWLACIDRVALRVAPGPPVRLSRAAVVVLPAGRSVVGVLPTVVVRGVEVGWAFLEPPELLVVEPVAAATLLGPVVMHLLELV